MASLDEFEEIVLPHLDRLYSFAYYLVGEEAEAEDLVQETMKKALNNFDRYEKGTNFRAWASRIMKNLMIDRKRKKKPSSTDFEKYEPASEEGSQPWPDTKLLSHDKLMERFFSDRVKEAVMNLPEDYRIAFLLNTIQDLSYEDISDIMDCPMGTVMSRLYRARQELKRELSDFARTRGYLDEEGETAKTSETKRNENQQKGGNTS